MMLLLALACQVMPTCLLLDGGFPGMVQAELATLESDCESGGGTDCDPATFVGVDAALCIARSHGLAEGTSGLTAHLVFNPELERVLWSVSNVEAENAVTGESSGSIVGIDAVTGELLTESRWEATP